MPFDNTSSQIPLDHPVSNTLAALGIQPVPRAVAEAHMASVTEQFRKRGSHHADLVEKGYARWAARWITINNNHHIYGNLSSDRYNIISYVPDFKKIRKQLLRSGGGLMSTPDGSAAPSAIIKVAAKVHRAIAGAKFSVAFFADDPILNVTYLDQNGELHHDCLGIWDHGKVIAIAVLPERSWITQLFNFFD